MQLAQEMDSFRICIHIKMAALVRRGTLTHCLALGVGWGLLQAAGALSLLVDYFAAWLKKENKC
jgi:hypothetical protein